MPIPLRNCVIEVRKGLRDGSASCKSDGGAKTGELQYKAGIKTGTEKRWDPTTGKLMLEAEWQDTDHLTKEENFDPNSGNRIYEAVWTKWSYGRQIDGDVKVYDPSGKLAQHFVFSGGDGKNMMPAKVDPVVVPVPATSDNVNACVDLWIAAFRKEMGPDALITSDQMGEWADRCRAGKHP